jgi:hypothetical protein
MEDVTIWYHTKRNIIVCHAWRWMLGADDVVGSFFGAKPLKHHRIVLGQKIIYWVHRVLGTYARNKPYIIADGVNESYFGQKWSPKNKNLSVKSTRLLHLIGINIFSKVCDVTPSKCGEHNDRIFILFPRIKVLVDVYGLGRKFLSLEKGLKWG